MIKKIFALCLFAILFSSTGTFASTASQDSDSGLVLTVKKDSVWERAGFKDGDTIKSINGVSTEHAKNAQSLINVMKSGGKEFKFKVLRAGKIIDIDVVIE